MRELISNNTTYLFLYFHIPYVITLISSCPSMNTGDLRAGNREGAPLEDKVSSRAYAVSH